MQQTEKYQLNLIEMGDTFALDPLNENARKTEAALAALDGADAAEAEAREALDQRVTTLELHKIAVGTVTTEPTAMTVELGFTPKAVILNRRSTSNVIIATTECCGSGTSHPRTEIAENGFTLAGESGFNGAKYSYHYIAFV